MSLIEAVIAGAGELGIPRNDDFNGARAGRRGLLPSDRPQGLAMQHRDCVS